MNPSYLCDVPPLQCFNQLTALQETWYECYATECHTVVLYNVLESVIAWRTQKDASYININAAYFGP
jgi:hypothetical protein